MVVYRVEDLEGLGPYRDIPDEHWRREMCDSHFWGSHPSAFPEPYQFCGFESLEQLKEWFGPWLKRLLKSGYRVVSYRTDHVVKKEKQVVFDRANAYWLEEIQ